MPGRLRESVRRWLEWVRRVITQPRSELDRWQSAVRYAYDLGRYGAGQLRTDNAPQMAAALSFRTLFGLLPVLVVGTILIRAFGGFDLMRERLGDFFTALKLDTVQVNAAASPTGSDAAGGEEAAVEAGQTLSQWLLDLVSQVEHINLAAITWVGVAVVIYAAVGLMVTIENSFNRIYRAPEGRSWAQRFPYYFTVLVLGPTAIALSAYLSNQFNAMIDEVEGSWGLLRIIPIFWAFAVTWLIMFLIYRWVPNTKVQYRPALIGAFVAAVLIEIGKRTLGVYMTNALSIQQLYGSLGLIPLFMFWVYLMWLIVLFGLEVAATLQMLRGRRLQEMTQKQPASGLVDPASVLAVMEVAAANFEGGQATSPRHIAEETRLPETLVAPMLEKLVASGLLHRVEGEDGSVSLARPADQISAEAVLGIGYALVEAMGEGGAVTLIERLRRAQLTAAADTTLAALTAQGPREAATAD